MRTYIYLREDLTMASESGESARARLIKSRRGTEIDESLLSAARRECLDILREAARESEDEGLLEMLRGERKRLKDTPLSDLTYSWDRGGLMWGGLQALRKKLVKYQLPEEHEAWNLAYEASQSAGLCGCCGYKLLAHEPAYFGAAVYVGTRPLSWGWGGKTLICKPRYERTVLCKACAPGWLSPERNDVTTQLCAHCERPMVSPLRLAELQRTFCSGSCRQAYHNQLSKAKRAEERERVCEVCGKEFTATRRDAQTCSAACKQKAYRQRKKEVRESR